MCKPNLGKSVKDATNRDGVKEADRSQTQESTVVGYDANQQARIHGRLSVQAQPWQIC